MKWKLKASWIELSILIVVLVLAFGRVAYRCSQDKPTILATPQKASDGALK